MSNSIWKNFKVSDVFDVVTGGLIDTSEIKDGSIPRITATSLNNGVARYTNVIKNNNNFRTYENIISVSFLGDIFYHPYEASFDMKIHGLIPKNMKLDKYKAMFLIPLLKKFSNKYSYGYQLSKETLSNQLLQLPTIDGEIHWDYMKEKSMEKFNLRKRLLLEYLDKKLSEMEYDILLENLKDKQWDSFHLDEIFSDIRRGKRLTKANQIAGIMPYISSTKLNNGINAFIGNKEKIALRNNSITIANSGSVGFSFYHPYTYIASDHVTTLELETHNKYIYLFLVNQLSVLKQKYNFNREINNARIARETIILPLDNNNKPDFNFIENYMKNKEYEKTKKLLDKIKMLN